MPEIYLASMNNGALHWLKPSASMTYLRTDGVISDKGAQIAWFGFRAADDGCEVEWRHKTVPSPLPSGRPVVVLKNGEGFDCTDGRYLAYVERDGAEWADPPPPPLSAPSGLDKLEPLKLKVFARRFLALPYVKRWWSEAYGQRTHFEQMRDGVVPKLFGDVAVEPHPAGLLLDFKVHLWNLFDSHWVAAAALEQRAHGLHGPLSLRRAVGGQDLRALLDCASLALDVPKA